MNKIATCPYCNISTDKKHGWNCPNRGLFEEERIKGVCKNCWNRGYSTQIIGGTITYGDFIGEKPRKTNKAEIVINFCNCENGKQLKSMIEEKIQEEKKKYVEEIEKWVEENSWISGDMSDSKHPKVVDLEEIKQRIKK